jgi:hypothetical protein
LLAGDELADLAPEPLAILEQVLVWLHHLACEDLDHSEDPSAAADREDEDAPQPGIEHEPDLGVLLFARDLADPVRFAIRPHAPREALAAREGRPLGFLLEALSLRIFRIDPDRRRSQDLLVGIGQPHNSRVPTERLADRLEQPRRGIEERFRHREHLADGTVCLELALRASPRHGEPDPARHQSEQLDLRAVEVAASPGPGAQRADGAARARDRGRQPTANPELDQRGGWSEAGFRLEVLDHDDRLIRPEDVVGL